MALSEAICVRIIRMTNINTFKKYLCEMNNIIIQKAPILLCVY